MGTDGFRALLGNESLKRGLCAALARGRISHFYLISGPDGAGKHTLARLLGAALLCRAPGDRPCGVCRDCRKAMQGTHPDFVTVDEPEKKTVSVELARKARADLFVRPNEAERKVYLFPRAQDMGAAAQNALLKVLEEPPEYGVFLLLTDEPAAMLPTVRSRCTELTLRPLPQETLRAALKAEFPEAKDAALAVAMARSGGYLGQAKAWLASGGGFSAQTAAFSAAFAARDALALLELLVPMEKWKRDALIGELSVWRQLVSEALLARGGLKAETAEAAKLAQARSARELSDAEAVLGQAIRYLQGNVSAAAVCGHLAWALR